MELNLPKKLQKSLDQEATDARLSLHAHILKKLERITPPVEYIKIDLLRDGIPKLIDFLNQVPSVRVISHNITSDAYWWIKIIIDIEHPLAWNVVQAFAHVFNELCIHEPLPTIFKPTSPPPYLNGGPDECLYWAIESSYNYIDPSSIAVTLQENLPNPIDDAEKWIIRDA